MLTKEESCGIINELSTTATITQLSKQNMCDDRTLKIEQHDKQNNHMMIAKNQVNFFETYSTFTNASDFV